MIKMSRKNDKKVEIIKVYENVTSPSTKFMSILDIIPLSLITCTIYPLVYEIISPFNLHDAITNTIMLFVYILMLWCASMFMNRMRKKRKGKDEFNLEKSEIAAVFNLMLLLNFICLLVLGFSKKDATYLTMATLSITLYVGFTISLGELFDKNRQNNLFIQLLTPFFDLGITKRDLWKLFITIGFAIVYMFLQYVVLCIVVISAIIFIILMVCGKRNAQSFGNEIAEAIDDEKILIVHLGAENSVTKTILKTIEKQYKVKDVTEQNFEQCKYDIIIVLNTLYRKDLYKLWLSNIEIILNHNGSIIDPFIDKKAKRRFLLSWFCIRPTLNRKMSAEEYMTIL